MRSFIVLFALVTGAVAAIQHPSPVYTRAASTVVHSTPVLPSGKSLPTTSNMNNSPMTSNTQGQEPLIMQPIAEAREGAFPAQDPAGQVQNAGEVAPVTNSANPSGQGQTFKIFYYPGVGQSGTGAYPTAYVPQQEIGFWQKYHMTDVVVGVAALAAVFGGGAILYPKFANVRASRAFKELADINSEDAARMTKGVFKALERLYELNNAE